MVELELVGLSEDGGQLVLADAAGDEFVVPLDGRLRALVRNGRVPTGQLETSMESAQAHSAQSALRPRDIQARIRAGETPESVAEVAQVPVDKIMGYAVPVMAERQHMAERAQRSAVRRRNAEGPTIQLWDAVAARLRDEKVDPMTCQWDAWRREDGRWTVTASYPGRQGERTGTFLFDALSRYAVAADDDARWLVGEPTAEQPGGTASAETRSSAERSRRGAGARRLSAVASEYDTLFDDDEPTADLTAVADVLGEADGAADDEQADRGPTGAPTPSVEEPVARTAAGQEPTHASAQRPAQQRGQQPKPEKRARRGRGRASVPSWDEIMFGQPKG